MTEDEFLEKNKEWLDLLTVIDEEIRGVTDDKGLTLDCNADNMIISYCEVIDEMCEARGMRSIYKTPIRLMKLQKSQR